MSVLFSSSLRVRLPVLILVLEVLLLLLFSLFVTYDEHAHALAQTNATDHMKNEVYRVYPFFADVQVMIFIGFACLLAFMRLYGFGGVVFNFLTATFSVQWAIIIQGFCHFYHDGKIHIGVFNFINAEFACAVVLISFGAVLGKTSPVQLLIMALLEIPIFAVTDWLIVTYLKINDAGGSIVIHIFACYFGLGVTRMLYRPSLNDGHANLTTSYQSDILSVLGTLFLWVFWPSFNSALTLPGDDQHRAIIHTFIGLSSSTLTAFALSALLDKKGKLSMSDIQNVTLAGGVTVGATVDMMVTPACAFALGVVGCCACMLGYKYLTPFMATKLKIQDQCGIHNLHGLTGLISTLAAIIAILMANEDTYGLSFYETFRYRAPTAEDPKLKELQSVFPDIQPGEGRSASQQAIYQVAALGLALATSVLGGLLTGAILKLPFLSQPTDDYCFDDRVYFEVPNDFDAASTPVNTYNMEDLKV
ncbi:rh50-like protein [Erpetoichthys calabaricus]|uniref:rh50-like protein n=1 Tax=Erpetoichthys calabaricus TaxID=27687 RepID=UPI002234CC27|nr:rh50-like protein [Erpetoichthys calabaricus]